MRRPLPETERQAHSPFDCDGEPRLCITPDHNDMGLRSQEARLPLLRTPQQVSETEQQEIPDTKGLRILGERQGRAGDSSNSALR
jgi:hypothetical protein